MEEATPLLLNAHIVAGAVSLVAAAIAIAAPKGRIVHRVAGRAFVLAMTLVFASAVMLSLRTNDLFLLVVGIFSYYIVLSGYRALYLKCPDRSADLRFRPGALDKGAAQFTLIACSGMAAYGAVYWYTPLATVLMVLGSIGALMALFDLRKFKAGAGDGNGWFFTHMIRMLGGTIASVTAFLVTNGDMLPPLVRWLAPTVIGTLAITLWVAWYKRKFALGAAPENVAEIRIGEPSGEEPE
ncbi:hypothetical protein NUH88_13960 [Nisaea acidiphila]|uniref:DUF2306 domain-containing protein n=1 Tax=Nisaea acidiphila TaxID=1862145 RepID=A0A9J7API8_9PROT|nr:hypothetical protein [Nisaea acidiphila]UUX48513.1 hypothetical protein NUH88_13960 [Nisaea acidiphila]